VWNIHKGLCAVYEVVQSIAAPLDAGFRECRLQEVEKYDSCNEDMAM
jgi:hypothetical protein